jgi:hypothetical protein
MLQVFWTFALVVLLNVVAAALVSVIRDAQRQKRAPARAESATVKTES